MSDRARYWAGLVAAWERSGLSQAAFCRRRGVNGGTFAWWKGRLRDGARDERAAERGPRKVSERFVEVQLPGLTAMPAYEIVLAHGRSIRIGVPFDPEVLSRLIAVVESC